MYIIRNINPNGLDKHYLYWNEPQGWGPRLNATVYTQKEKDNYQGWLPVGGEWLEL